MSPRPQHGMPQGSVQSMMAASQHPSPLGAARRVLLLLLLAAPAALVRAADVRACLEAADKLAAAKQHRAAADAYLNCSSSAASDGRAAGCALFKAHSVLHEHLGDEAAALAACTAGWEASHAAELAWCAAATSHRLNKPDAAARWAHDAIGAGCYNGSCSSLAGTPCAPTPTELLWDAPFRVLVDTAAAAGDVMGGVAARLKAHEASAALKFWRFKGDAGYKEVLAHEHIPAASRVEQAGACGTSALPPAPNTTAFDSYRPSLHVITTATDLHRHQMANLLRTADAHGLHLSVLSPTAQMGHPAGGKFGLRLQLAANFLNMLHEEDYVMAVDAYDVAFAGGAADIIAGFREAVGGRDVALFGAETGLWPDEGLKDLYPPAPTKYRYLNAGGFMGTVRALRCLLAAVGVNLTDSRFVFNDDQHLFSTLFVHAANATAPLIQLDYTHRVFAPLWDIDQRPTFQALGFRPNDWAPSRDKGVFTNKLTGGTPLVFHANGNQPTQFLDQMLVPTIMAAAAARAQRRATPAAGAPTTATAPRSMLRDNARPQPPVVLEDQQGSSSPLMAFVRGHASGLFMLLVALLLVCEGIKGEAERRKALQKDRLL